MPRKPGTKNREPQNQVKALMEYVASCKTDFTACCSCGEVPMKGAVIPGLYDYVRLGDATLQGLQEKMARDGWWCRSCLIKRARQAQAELREDGKRFREDYRARLDETTKRTVARVDSLADQNASALKALDDRLAQLGQNLKS